MMSLRSAAQRTLFGMVIILDDLCTDATDEVQDAVNEEHVVTWGLPHACVV